MFFLTLLHHIKSIECKDLPDWQLNCTRIPTDRDNYTYTIKCPKNGKYPYTCTPYVDCEGSQEVTKTLECYPSEGKNVGTALCLSVVLGFLGVDRFYLGYPTIGVFKLFTGGFFGLGWYIDIFLIALRIVKPARGGKYAFQEGANFLVRLPDKIYF